MANSFEADRRRTLGKHEVAPRACVIVGKHQLQTFLSEGLEKLGLIVCNCGSADRFTEALGRHHPDLVISSLSDGGMKAARAREIATAQGFAGKVLLLGPTTSPMVSAIHTVGEQHGLAMLPIPRTRFADRELRVGWDELRTGAAQ